LFLPAAITFFITLIPTINYDWPLSWDIYRHIHLAQIYAQYGFVFTDPAINMPLGEKINYPPLFHFLIIFLGIFIKNNYFAVLKILQPVFAMLLVFSVSYVAKKLYGLLAGFMAGFLILASGMFARVILAIPENFALILFPIGVYLYYKSLEENNFSYILVSGLILFITFFIHKMAPASLIIVITLFTFLIMLKDRSRKPFFAYIEWLAIGLLPILLISMIIFLFQPEIIKNILGGSASPKTIIDYFTYGYTRILPLIQYPYSLGLITSFFGLLGIILGFINRDKRDILLLSWLGSMFIFSMAYLIGITVISYRLLIYMLLPLSILGGVGVKFIFGKLARQNLVFPRILSTIFLVIIIGFSISSATILVLNPQTATFGTETEFGLVQTAPPTFSEVDLARWFNQNGDRNVMMVSSNYYVSIFILSTTGQPLQKSKDALIGNSSREIFLDSKVKYLVFDKKLFYNNNEKPYIITDNGYLLYFNKKQNNTSIIPSYAKIVYSNQDYIVCEVV
jgi:uncharacterized membrane protein